MPSVFRWSGFLFSVGLFILLQPYNQALATTIVVNSTADSTAVDGACTLREAISAANTNAAVNECPAGQAAPTVDVIDLTGLAGSVTLGGTELAISEDADIKGPGADVLSIDANNASRVFNITSGIVNMAGLTVTGGKSTTGCGILNSGTLTLTECAVSGNSDVSTTTSQHLGGGILNSNSATLVVLRCAIAGNSLTAATSLNGGGGILNFGTLTLANSTVSGNSVTSSTSGTQGAGIANLGSMTITNCTIAGNTASSPGPDAGGGIFDKRTNAQTATMTNTIVTDNTGDSGADGLIWGILGGGAFVSGGHNLIGTAFLLLDGGLYTAGTGDQIGTGNANLGPLQSNGGPTPTMALLPGSTAIDTADDIVCATAPINNVDQRGLNRPQDGDNDTIAHCDIGAFEVQAIPPCLFCDDFNDGIFPADWTVVKPAWTESGGSLNGKPARKAVIVAKPAFAGCLNCSVETRVQLTGGVGNRVWILNHYVDKNNTMELMLKQESNKVILKQRAGGRIVTKAKGSVTLLPNTFYTAKATFNGTQFEVFVDGVSLLTLVPAGSVPVGTVGFQVKNTIGSFDYIQVN